MNDSLLTIDNGTPFVSLHAGQSQAYSSRARFILVSAGFQSGKTCFGPIWLWREIAERGPGDYIAASSTYDLFKLKMLPALRSCFEDVYGWSFVASERVLVNPKRNTRIILRSAESEGGLESATAKAAWLDEWGQLSVSLTDWEAVQRRLAIHRGRALLTTTPYGWNWVKTHIWDRAKGGDPEYEIVNFRSIDNPAFPPEEYYRMQQELPDWRFQMFCNGLFTRPAGQIYQDFDEAHQVVKPFAIPAEWTRHVGVDPGLVNTAVIWIAEDPQQGHLYVYREHLGGGLTGPEMAQRCLEYSEPVRYWWGGAKSEDEQRRQWQQAGVGLSRPVISDLEAGIDHVTGLIKSRRLRVFSTCTGLLGEIQSYSRELDASGEPTEKIADKQTYHRLDALRYGLSGVPLEFDAPPEPEPERSLRTPSRVVEDDDDSGDMIDDYW